VFRYGSVNNILPLLNSGSLTQEATLQEVDNLRKQILRIKGGDTVRERVLIYYRMSGELVNIRLHRSLSLEQSSIL